MSVHLAKSKLDSFKTWLDDNGFAHRPGKGEWQALQVKLETDGWQILYATKATPNHLKVGEKLEGLVTRFLNTVVR